MVMIFNTLKQVIFVFVCISFCRSRGGGRSGYDTPPSRSRRDREGSMESGLEADLPATDD